MKKIFKTCLVAFVAVCLSFPLVACKKKVSPTTTKVDNVKIVNGKTTNGGMTVVHGEYLYFINGTKTNDGSSQKNNKRSAICRVKYNVATGETSGDMEVVIDELVGYEDGSINIFGDYLYYTTPCSDKNSNATILYNKTAFKRYDLVNEKSYTIYTTELNSSSETIEYAYYISGETLNLLVYEKTNASLRSIKVDTEVTMNYEITEVTDCLFSENYGKPTTSKDVDANSFVFYTKSPESGDAVQTGSKVYKTSPVTNNSVKISEGASITLTSIRAGKLLYTFDGVVCAQEITAKTDEALLVNKTNCISRAELTTVIYLENYKLEGKNETAKLVKSEGEITVFAFNEIKDSDSYFSLFQWKDVNSPINHTTVSRTTKVTEFEFLGFDIVEEITEEDDKDTDENEEVKEKFLCAFYKESSKIYKVHIAKLDDGNANSMSVTIHAEKVKLSDSTLTATTGTLLPESIGNFMFILSETDKISYLIKVDLSVTETVTTKTDIFGIQEK